MMILTLIGLSLTLAALYISICAWIAARHTSDRALSKQVSALSTRFQDLEDTLEQLAQAQVTLRNRLNMRTLREKRKNGEDGGADSVTDSATASPPGESANERWARDMNRRIAEGRVRPGSR